MGVKGLMNMQYAIENDKVYVLEANPRASRTVPLVSKVCNIRMVPLAIDIVTSELTGRPSPVPGLKEKNIPYYGVKESVFPFNMFQEVDPVLGPEMRSTGEVLGLSEFYGEAFFKAQEATQTKLPMSGTVLFPSAIRIRQSCRRWQRALQMQASISSQQKAPRRFWQMQALFPSSSIS